MLARYVRFAFLVLLLPTVLTGCGHHWHCYGSKNASGAGPIVEQDQTLAQRHFLGWLEQTGVQTFYEGESLRFIIPMDLLYPPSSIALKDSGESILDVIIDVIHNYGNPSVTVIGHSDDVGSEHEKLDRSVYQAHNVAAYLWAHDVKSDSIKILGVAKHQPVSNHRYIDRYPTNRRIEIRLF